MWCFMDIEAYYMRLLRLAEGKSKKQNGCSEEQPLIH
jgi:hypothetical protein